MCRVVATRAVPFHNPSAQGKGECVGEEGDYGSSCLSYLKKTLAKSGDYTQIRDEVRGVQISGSQYREIWTGGGNPN